MKFLKTAFQFKNIKYPAIAIFILGLLLLKPYLHQGFPFTHDGENHLARFANYKLALKEGQIPPRWAPNLHNRYGYPVFNYNYPLANMLSVPFSVLKLNYELTFKLLAVIFAYAGLIGAYRWLGYFKFSQKARLFGLAVFGTSPYLYSTILYRGNIGEIAAWGLVPWLFVIVETYATSKKITSKMVSLAAFVLGLFLLSHNVAVMMAVPTLLFYTVLRFAKNWEKWKWFLTTFVYGVLLSLWFWLPALAEKHLVILNGTDLSTGFGMHFPTVNQLLFSPVLFGFSYAGRIDSLSFSLGITQLVILLTGVSIIFTKKQKLINFWFWSGLIFFMIMLIFAQLSLSQPLWQILPFAQFIQFPWRLGLIFGVLIVPIASLCFFKLNKHWQLLLSILLTWQVIGLIRHQPIDYFHKLNRDYDAFSQTTSTLNENMPNKFSYSNISDWQPTPMIVAGDGQITVDYWKGSDRQYQLELTETSAIVEPTARFAGWTTYIQRQGQEQEKEKVAYIDNPIIQGRLAYELEPGSYLVRSRFTQWTWPRLIGNTFSLVTFVLLIFNLVLISLFRRNT